MIGDNQAPVLPGRTIIVSEATAVGTAVLGLSANDPEGNAITYNVQGLGGTFAEEAGQPTGRRVKLTQPLDFEGGTRQFSIQVAANDGVMTTNATFVINVLDVNERPTISLSSSDEKLIEFNKVAGDTVDVGLSSTDPENDPRDYVITAGDTGRFEITPGGQLRLKQDARTSPTDVYQLKVKVREQFPKNLESEEVTLNLLVQDGVSVFGDIVGVEGVDQLVVNIVRRQTAAIRPITVSFTVSPGQGLDFAQDFLTFSTAYGWPELQGASIVLGGLASTANPSPKNAVAYGLKPKADTVAEGPEKFNVKISSGTGYVAADGWLPNDWLQNGVQARTTRPSTDMDFYVYHGLTVFASTNDNPLLSDFGSPADPNDVNQGATANCQCVAVMMALAQKHGDWLTSRIQHKSGGAWNEFEVLTHQNVLGQWREFWTPVTLSLDFTSGSLSSADYIVMAGQLEVWTLVLEKIGSNNVENFWEYLRGPNTADEIANPTAAELTAVMAGQPPSTGFVVTTNNESSGVLVSGHAYLVDSFDGFGVILRNPHDGQTLGESISYEALALWTDKLFVLR